MPRFGHTLTYYSPGKVVLFGGATGHASQYSITDSTYTFDLSTKIWSKVLSNNFVMQPLEQSRRLEQPMVLSVTKPISC